MNKTNEPPVVIRRLKLEGGGGLWSVEAPGVITAYFTSLHLALRDALVQACGPGQFGASYWDSTGNEPPRELGMVGLLRMYFDTEDGGPR